MFYMPTRKREFTTPRDRGCLITGTHIIQTQPIPYCIYHQKQFRFSCIRQFKATSRTNLRTRGHIQRAHPTGLPG